MATRSFIARPTSSGYSGIYVHGDGVPSHRLPLLLTARRYRFEGDTEALARHLIDDVATGWAELGTDLLTGAPPVLACALTDGEQWPSRIVGTPADGSPPQRMTVTHETAAEQDLEWGYVLHPHGIEVISLLHEETGPIVPWDTDPRTAFSDHPARWATASSPLGTAPRRSAPPHATPAASHAKPRTSRGAARG